MPFPPKTFIPYNDFYISCILAGGKEYHFAIAENFIRCYAEEEVTSDWIDYFESQKYGYYGIFKGFELTSDVLRVLSTEISESIIGYLNTGYAIIYNVDTFYVKNYATFNHYHSIHSLMIYDYDDQGNFICRDYFDFMNYSEQLVSMYEINKSYREVYRSSSNYNTFLMMGIKIDDDISCNSINNLKPFYNQRKPDIKYLEKLGDKIHRDILNNSVCNIQLPYNKNNIQINMEKILFLLREFINGDNYVEHDVRYVLNSESKYKTGINVFDSVINKIIYVFSERPDLLNMRLIKFIEHHIFMMKERIRIMRNEYGILLSDELFHHSLDLVKKSEQFTFMIIKLSIKRNEAEMMRTVAFLNKLKGEYIELIKRLIIELEKEFYNSSVSVKYDNSI